MLRKFILITLLKIITVDEMGVDEMGITRSGNIPYMEHNYVLWIDFFTKLFSPFIPFLISLSDTVQFM